jgi:hypothetical protein
MLTNAASGWRDKHDTQSMSFTRAKSIMKGKSRAFDAGP